MRIALILALLGGVAAAAPTRTSQDDPHPGIHHEVWVDSAIPARIQLVRVDLTSAEIALYATKESDRGLTTAGYATRLDAQVAINGDAFAVAGFVPRGLAIGDSAPWTNTADDASSALVHLRRVGERTVGAIVTPEVVVGLGDLPDGTQALVSGRPLLVRNGASETQFDCDDPITLACERAPRSAAGLSADGNTLWLVAIDGWQSGSLGMTAAELASFMNARGANLALALDGGSSSTLVVDGATLNHPSDGVAVPVANHLAVKYGALPRGQLVGVICLHDVFSCTTRITGATVTLDDGRVQTTASDGFYDFQNVTPRLACVTVRKTGYHTVHQCQTVDSGIQTYNSVALHEGTDILDAGIPDDGPLATDDADLGSGNFGHDAGDFDNSGGGGGGCCDAGGSPVGSGALFAVVVGWSRRRKRGTTTPT